MAIFNNAVRNIGMQISLCDADFNSFGCITLEERLLGHMVISSFISIVIMMYILILSTSSITLGIFCLFGNSQLAPHFSTRDFSTYSIIDMLAKY